MFLLSIVIFYKYDQDNNTVAPNFNLVVDLKVSSPSPTEMKLYYKATEEENFNEGQTISEVIESDEKKSLSFELPPEGRILRLDLGEGSRKIELYNIYIKKGVASEPINLGKLKEEGKSDDISSVNLTKEGSLAVVTNGIDPFFVLGDVTGQVKQVMASKFNFFVFVVIPSVAVSLLILVFLFILKAIGWGYFKSFIMDIITSRRLIMNLARNDFSSKYKGAFFGIAWAILSPLLTILVYWFVFQVGFRSSNVDEVPFVLWFIPGIIPWFYFSEALGVVTSSFMEYSYLVKKMVFKINILPVVKMLSIIPINILLVVLAFTVYFSYGNGFHMYNLQVIYYYLCLLVLCYGITLISSSILLFFKDLNQIIGILLQFGFWLTPIVWNMDIITSPALVAFFKFNPMIYIVDGFRDALIYKVWFFDKPWYTLYFWSLSIFMLFSGIFVFKKLKPHFSDVL